MSVELVIGQALPAGAVVLRSAQLHLDPEPRNVVRARQWVTEQTPELGPDGLHTLRLLTSELVTNAVVHARTEVEVGIAVTEHEVLVTVHDLDLGRREQRTHDRDGGRGLGLVRDLSVASGQTSHPGGGKTAWFRLMLDQTSPEEPS